MSRESLVMITQILPTGRPRVEGREGEECGIRFVFYISERERKVLGLSYIVVSKLRMYIYR